MATSIYKNDFDKKKRIGYNLHNLKSEKINMEIEQNKVFTIVREKNKFKGDSMTSAKQAAKDIYGPSSDKLNKSKSTALTYMKSKELCQTPDVKLIQNEKRELENDEDLVKINQVQQLSLYGKDYPNWGRLEQKLDEKRPEEKYYRLNFYGQSSYASNNIKVAQKRKSVQHPTEE